MSKKMSNEILDNIKNSAWLGVQGKITAVSLTLPKHLTYDQWAAIGPRIARVKRFTSWAISDWLNYGEARYGETYAQAVEATGFQPDYLAILKYVASRVDPSRRRESLPFGHHRLVASLEPEEQEKFLQEAESNGWTHDELRQAIRLKDAPGRAPTLEESEERMKKPDYTIPTRDGGPGQVTVEHSPEYSRGRVRMVIDLCPGREPDHYGDYLAVYLTPTEARKVAAALLAVAVDDADFDGSVLR
jgi:hypothetical protein